MALICPYCECQDISRFGEGDVINLSIPVMDRNHNIEVQVKNVVFPGENFCRRCLAVEITGLNWEGSTEKEQKFGWRRRIIKLIEDPRL